MIPELFACARGPLEICEVACRPVQLDHPSNYESVPKGAVLLGYNRGPVRRDLVIICIRGLVQHKFVELVRKGY